MSNMLNINKIGIIFIVDVCLRKCRGNMCRIEKKHPQRHNTDHEYYTQCFLHSHFTTNIMSVNAVNI